MKKSRVLALLLAFVMIFALAACGSTSTETAAPAEVKPANDEAQEATENTEQAAEPAATVNFPTQPVKIIVQYGAGGGVDVTARLVAKYAEKYLGQSIVVENVTGGAGVVGLNTLAQSDPDGYTLGLIFANTAIESLITEGVNYSLDSFAPICQINFDPAFLVARAGSEYDTDIDAIKEMANSEQVTVGIGALWQAFDFVKMSLQADYGIPLVRVAYDGGAAACTSVVSGDTDLALVFPNEWVSYYNSGDLNGVAVAAPERLEAFPNVPTFKELGYDKCESFGVRRMLVAPAGTDPQVLAILEDAFLQALNDPELVAEYAELGMSCVPASADEAYASISSDADALKALIEAFNVKPGDAPT